MIGSPEFIFKTFERVLVRKTDIGPGAYWNPNIYLYSSEGMHRFLGGPDIPASRCEVIAYEGNEYLTGTCDIPDVKWEPQPGELVAVQGIGSDSWGARIFVRYNEDGKPVCRHEGYPDKEQLWQRCEPAREHFSIPEE